MPIGPDASRILKFLREKYVEAGYPNHRVWTFTPGSDDVTAFAELRAHRYVKQLTMGKPTSARWVLTDSGLREILGTQASPSATRPDQVRDSHYSLNIANSTVGAIALGEGAGAEGAVQVQRVERQPKRSDSGAKTRDHCAGEGTSLTQEHILEVHATAVEAALHDNRLALTAGLDRHLLASLPRMAEPGAQLLADLFALNDLARAGNSAPLMIWLRAAVALRASSPQASTFRHFLTRLTGESA